jgi:uncharacterized protein involved in exopolysaccharide biosynthesis
MQERAERYTHLRDYWRVIYKRKHLVLACFVIVVGTVIYASTKQIPVYQSSCKIMLEREKYEVDVMPGQVIKMDKTARRDYYEAQYEIIRSYDVAKRAARMLGLSGQNIEQAAREIQGAVSIKPFGGRWPPTNIAFIVATHTNPKMAMDIANTVAQAYIEQREYDREELLQETYEVFKEEIMSAKEQLLESEEALEAYKLKKGIVTISEGKDLDEQMMSEFNVNLAKLQAERIEKGAFLESVKKTLPSDSVMALTVIAEKSRSGLVNIDLKKRLFDLQQQLKELRLKYREKHPEITRVNREIEAIKTEIADEVKRIISSLELEIETLKTKEKTLLGFLKNPEKPSSGSRENVEYLSLKREVETNRDIYTTLLKRLKEMDVEEAMAKFPELKIIEPAKLPRRPVPTQRVNILVSPIVGLLLGVGMALFLEYLDNSIKTVEDVNRYLGLPVLGIIPHIHSSDRKRRH